MTEKTEKVWGKYSRKELSPGNVVCVRWEDVPDELGVLVRIDEHPANFKGDIGGQFLNLHGELRNFDTLGQIVALQGNVLSDYVEAFDLLLPLAP